jgi:hypothetical protein
MSMTSACDDEVWRSLLNTLSTITTLEWSGVRNTENMKYIMLRPDRDRGFDP